MELHTNAGLLLYDSGGYTTDNAFARHRGGNDWDDEDDWDNEGGWDE